jgi:hypothetical protein
MRSLAAITFLTLLLCAPGTALAQAYLDPPNSLSVALGYTYGPSGKIVAETGGLEVPATDMFVHLFTPSAQYVTPVDGLAVEAELGMMAIKIGSDDFDHFPTNGPYDDGNLHFTPTDFRAGLRYQLKAIEDVLGLSFVLAGSVPTRDYPTNGLSAPGHHLKALYVGAAIARTFDPLLPNMYFQADYQFALRERVKVDQATEDLNRNFSEASVLLGYFLPADFSIGAGANARFSHGGADFDTIIFQPESIQFNHDRLLDEDFILAGGNLGYDVSETLELGASARFFVWGENTRNQNLFSLYASYKIF